MFRPDWLFSWKELEGGVGRQLAPGVTARIFAGDQAMVSVVRLEPHAANELHSHPEEQWGCLLEGQCIRIQDGIETAVRAGDFWHTPGNVVHAMRALESPAVVMDIFSPPREAYLANARPSAYATNDLQAQQELGTSMLTDVCDQARRLPGRIRHLAGSSKILGRAFTVDCPAGDNLWLHRAVYAASDGDVLVASTGRRRGVAYWGDLLSIAAAQRGIGGLVIDGCVRDAEQIQRLSFAVFGNGYCSRGPTKLKELTGSMGRPIRVGDTTIHTGDLVVADRDGIIVLPRQAAEAAFSAARDRWELESGIIERLRKGERTIDLLGLA